MDDMSPIIGEFLTESYENLDQLDQDLVGLEANPEEKSLLASIFRTIHTIKGTCGFLGFTKLESVAHVGENLLSKLRDGELSMTSDIADSLLMMVDAVREILSNIESNRSEGDIDYSDLIELITYLQSGQNPEPKTIETVKAARKKRNRPAKESMPVGDDAVPLAEEKKSERRDAVERRSGNIEAEEAYLAKHKDRRSESDRRTESIRVNVDILDRLMNLVGELVLARNQMVQLTATEQDPSYLSTTQHLDQLTSELQEGVMKTRMQPIGNIWNKFPRVVRDLATACGKKVRLHMEGKSTELDKTVIEAVKDPLTHIIRNSVDHGIETPDERVAIGKNPEGRLSLRASHEGGQVIIEIKDDGGGIDPENIKTKALSKNLITPQEADRMSDRELINLIFTQGFSTAETVSHLSGRGVGMDVVKANIEKIGGTVDIHSKVGQGMTLKVKIPLTLAIIPALIVTCGALRYAIPQVSLVELFRLEVVEGESDIETIQESPFYRLRGKLLPLVYLSELLQIENQPNSDAVNVVVLQAGACQFGLVVDGINDTEEIVVKPLSKLLKGMTPYAGATIMGDGKVVLILDAMGVAQKAHVAYQEDRDPVREDIKDEKEAKGVDRQPLLIFSPGNETRMAVPLTLVARLEEFNQSMLENSDERPVVQYRGDIMPLIFLSDVFGMNTTEVKEGPVRVIVYSAQGRSVGVVVDKIIDIVEESVTLKKGAVRPGLLGSAVVQDKVTDLLDVEGVIRRVDPEFYKTRTVASSKNLE